MSDGAVMSATTSVMVGMRGMRIGRGAIVQSETMTDMRQSAGATMMTTVAVGAGGTGLVVLANGLSSRERQQHEI
jgi:hypothetical protein